MRANVRFEEIAQLLHRTFECVKWNTLHSLLCLVLIGWFLQVLSLDYSNQHNHVRGDGLGYYSYLAGSLIHQDPLNTFYADLDIDERQRYWLYEGKEGAFLPKMTLGLALAWLPGFIVAHAMASLLGHAADGWSAPYMISILLTALIALLLGSFFTYSLLKKYFSQTASAIAVLLIVFGTSLLHYSASEVSMSHVYSFALIGAFLYFIQNFFDGQRGRDLILAGLFLGWAILIRPTNAIVALFPLIILLKNPSDWKYLLTPAALWSLLAFSIPLVLQMSYWKITTQQWVYYSYADEAFFWLKPHLWEGLFSYRNGWLVYTPLFLLSLPGWYWAWKRSETWAIAGLLVLVLHVYITFSWWCWYYGDSLSIRPMIDMYAVFALPIAAFIHYVWNVSKHQKGRYVLFGVMILLITNNVLQIKHYNNGLITGSTMTKEVFWATFLNPNPPNHFNLLHAYNDPDTDRLRKGLEERTVFDTLQLMEPIVRLFDDQQHTIQGEDAYSSPIEWNGEKVNLNTNQNEYLVLSWRLELVEGPPPVLVFEFKKEEDQTMSYQTLELEALDFSEGMNSAPPCFLRTPGTKDEKLVLKTYAWNNNGGQSRVSSVSLKKVRITYHEDQ